MHSFTLATAAVSVSKAVCMQAARRDIIDMSPRMIGEKLLSEMEDGLRALSHLHRLRNFDMEPDVEHSLWRFTCRLVQEEVWRTWCMPMLPGVACHPVTQRLPSYVPSPLISSTACQYCVIMPTSSCCALHAITHHERSSQPTLAHSSASAEVRPTRHVAVPGDARQTTLAPGMMAAADGAGELL